MQVVPSSSTVTTPSAEAVKRDITEWGKIFFLAYSELFSAAPCDAGSLGPFLLRPSGQRDQKFVQFWAPPCLACRQTWGSVRQRVLDCVSQKGCELGVRQVRVECLGYFTERKNHSQPTIPWEGERVPISLLQGCR